MLTITIVNAVAKTKYYDLQSFHINKNNIIFLNLHRTKNNLISNDYI
ncbi:hypothetical protein Riv7116_1475 [Rivularia sp. PCC 7116]|nr:hypothetical protein Riv7116_1475 [Rivularia sp. PCC 7116]